MAEKEAAEAVAAIAEKTLRGTALGVDVTPKNMGMCGGWFLGEFGKLKQVRLDGEVLKTYVYIYISVYICGFQVRNGGDWRK